MGQMAEDRKRNRRRRKTVSASTQTLPTVSEHNHRATPDFNDEIDPRLQGCKIVTYFAFFNQSMFYVFFLIFNVSYLKGNYYG